MMYTTNFLTNNPLSIVEMHRLYKLMGKYYSDINNIRKLELISPTTLEPPMQRWTYEKMGYRYNKWEKLIAHILYMEELYSKVKTKVRLSVNDYSVEIIIDI